MIRPRDASPQPTHWYTRPHETSLEATATRLSRRSIRSPRTPGIGACGRCLRTRPRQPRPRPAAPPRTPAQAMAQALGRHEPARTPGRLRVVGPAGHCALPHAGAPRQTRIIPRWVPWAAGGAAAADRADRHRSSSCSRGRTPCACPRSRGSTQGGRDASAGAGPAPRRRAITASPPRPLSGRSSTSVRHPGTLVQAGGTVTVAISGGSETFAMPDVIGQTLDAARAEAARTRAVGRVPDCAVRQGPGDRRIVRALPGQTIQTGDTVRLTIAAGASGTDTLLPVGPEGQDVRARPRPDARRQRR